MGFRAQNPKRQSEILVITPAFAEPEGRAAHVVGDLITAISASAPFRFTWAAHASKTLPEIPGQTVLPMRGWKIATVLPGLRWLFWDRASLAALHRAIAK